MAGAPRIIANKSAPLTKALCVYMKLYLTFIFVIFLSSCSKVEEAPERTFDHSQEFIDFSVEIHGNWEKVCVITPYSNNQFAEELLGFKFDIEAKSGISVLDGITLLVVTSENKVVKYFEVSRDNIDFSSLKASCYNKSDSEFKIINSNGWYSVKHT